MKAILLNPATNTVTEVEYNGIESMCKHLDCDTVTTFPIYHEKIGPSKNFAFCDDEGLLQSGIVSATKFKNYSSPVVGKVLFLGDSYGHSCDTTLTVSEVNDMVEEYGFLML